MNTARALLYARTIRTLRPTQVIGRVWRALHTPKPDLSPAPKLREARRWQSCARRPASWLSATRRRFLNEEREVTCAADWNAPEVAKLWLYNLHYFDDLNAEGAEERSTWHEAGIAAWIEDNQPGTGNGWEPYCISLRATNWIKWSLAGHRLTPEAVHSLAVQTRFLRASLETHLLGNHLFANAKALIFAGCFFEGPEAAGWLERGLTIVQRELEEQVLYDGGHFERSPMYHSLMLEDLLDLLNLTDAYSTALPSRWMGQRAQWRNTARRMRRWLVLMTHPDGELALFNDSAFNVAPHPDELHGYARRLGLGPVFMPGLGAHHLAHTGYVRIETPEAAAILDVGEIGPSYLPGHAHADSLSFELSVLGERVVVDSGTSLYEAGSERLRQRSTAAHNTLVIDDESSSEVWSSFRVARRAEPLGLSLEEHEGEITVRCSHDGYMRLPGHVVHSRSWRFSGCELEVSDRIAGLYRTAVTRMHLHPAIAHAADGRLSLPSDEALPGAPLLGNAIAYHTVGATVTREASTWHPEFGVSLPSQCLRFDLTSPTSSVTLSW